MFLCTKTELIRRRVTPVLMGIFLLATAAGAQTAAKADANQNAALFYWKAIALMQTPETAEQTEIVQFVEKDLAPLPPRIFAVRPDVLRWLLNERPMVSALNQAALRTTCAFPLRIEGEAGLDLSHIARLRVMALRAVAAAKACEAADNSQGAAMIYADLLRLARQMDQDMNLTSGLFGAELLQKTLWELEGFFSRRQPGDAVAILAREFKDGRQPLFHPGSYIRDEARRYSDWLLVSPDRTMERLNRLYGNARFRPAVEQLMSLQEAKKAQRLSAWVDGYRKRMNALADACEMPFNDAVPRIRGFDAEKLADQRDPSGGENPLIPLLVPTTQAFYERFLLAEGHYDMIDVLSQAALFRADTGAWPAKPAEINQFSHRTLPVDPFSGEEMFYRLDNDLPELAMRVPKKMAVKEEHLFSVSLAQRRANDEERREAATKRILKERRESINIPVPMK